MHVELTVIHNEQRYTLSGEAIISELKDVAGTQYTGFIRVTFADKTDDELIEWQKPFDWDDKCILETPTEAYEGLYKTSSRMDRSPIIWHTPIVKIK